MDVGIKIDLDGFRRRMGDVAERGLPLAAASTLNAAAFSAQRGLKETMASDFDRPNAFTMRAWRVEKAKPMSSFSSMSAVVYAHPTQAGYLMLQITGGERRPGMPGAGGRRDIFTGAHRANAHGGIPARLLAQLSRGLQQERADRAAWRQLQDQRQEGVNRQSYQPAHKPGIFFGSVGNSKGYWRRPQRRGGENMGRLTLLLRVDDVAMYRPLLPYNAAVTAAGGRMQVDFAREVQFQLERANRRG